MEVVRLGEIDVRNRNQFSDKEMKTWMDLVDKSGLFENKEKDTVLNFLNYMNDYITITKYVQQSRDIYSNMEKEGYSEDFLDKNILAIYSSKITYPPVVVGENMRCLRCDKIVGSCKDKGIYICECGCKLDFNNPIKEDTKITKR